MSGTEEATNLRMFFSRTRKTEIEISKERKTNSNKVKFSRMSNCNSRENDKRKKNKFLGDNVADGKGQFKKMTKNLRRKCVITSKEKRGYFIKR